LILATSLSGVAHAQKRVPSGPIGNDDFLKPTPGQKTKPVGPATRGGAADDAPKQPSQPLIDANFYYDRYPDLVVLGRDRAALEKLLAGLLVTPP